MRKIIKIIELIVLFSGFISIVVLVLNFFGVLPYYDVHYIKKTEITPRTSVFPGQVVRLTTDFTSAVDLPQLERVIWDLTTASGRSYGSFEGGREIDVQLLPDFSGIINIGVKARVRGESAERNGVTSLHIAQDKPRKITIQAARFQAPLDWKGLDSTKFQVYAGNNQWLDTTGLKLTDYKGNMKFVIENSNIPVWDGKTYFRYKATDKPPDISKYRALDVEAQSLDKEH